MTKDRHTGKTMTFSNESVMNHLNTDKLLKSEIPFLASYCSMKELMKLGEKLQKKRTSHSNLSKNPAYTTQS